MLLVPAIVAVGAMLGGVYGPALPGVSAASSEDEIKSSLRTFSDFYAVVEANFSDSISADDAIYDGAIPGMLRTLDPHSSFFDPRDFQLLREDQKGAYYGVGMFVVGRGGKTIVVNPFKDSPAYRAGIHPGDSIEAVDDKSTEGLDTTQVAELLKGPKGTKVSITVRREGRPDPLIFTVVRDEIPRYSVNDSFFLKDKIAYIAIEQFNDNTSRELDEALSALKKKQTIAGLVLDLRGNPGGLLNEGVAVAGRFLEKGQVIVKHRGRTSPEKPYIARKGNHGNNYPVVVLVDRYSASAAEIVAGAMQDHDRAWVLGENTFGKGLVQTVYPLAENSGLALTTARYYTPRGRLIQRSYKGKSFFDYYYRDRDDTAPNPDDVKMTDSGRTVYGGGGITPDEKFEQPAVTELQRKLARNYAFFNFTAKYFGTHSTDLPPGWEPGQSVENDFHRYVLDQGIEFTEAEWAENQAWISQQLKREMYITAFSVDESRKITIETDAAVLKAVESMPKAAALLNRAKQVLAQRNKGRE
jgi:carboxyl-terminal processing protease